MINYFTCKQENFLSFISIFYYLFKNLQLNLLDNNKYIKLDTLFISFCSYEIFNLLSNVLYFFQKKYDSKE